MALTKADKDRIAKIAQTVRENKVHLKTVTTHHELKEFAVQQNWWDKKNFGAFKRSLLKIGISYDHLREKTLAEEAIIKAEALEQLTEDAPTVTLWSAAHENNEGEQMSFAIVTADRDTVWYGDFFKDNNAPTDLIAAEQEAARRAIFVAAKALKAAGHVAGRATIITDCPKLDEEALITAGIHYGVDVTIKVDREDERAFFIAQQPGFMHLKEYENLADLVMVVNDETNDDSDLEDE